MLVVCDFLVDLHHPQKGVWRGWIFLARSGWLAYDVAPDLAISSGETDVAMTATATAYISYIVVREKL